MGLFSFRKKIIGCRGALCPWKSECKKHTNFTNNRYTTSYDKIPYSHITKTCSKFEHNESTEKDD